MKELYIAPELEIVTFVAMEELAAGYLSGYVKTIGGSGSTVYADDASGTETTAWNGDIDVSIPGAEQP